MATIQLRDQTMHTYTALPAIGEVAPNFRLTNKLLHAVQLADFVGKTLLLNVYPSIDTEVCFNSVKYFGDALANSKNSNITLACVSMDLPFALQRVAAAEHLDSIELLSDFRNRDFGAAYGLTIADGSLAGLLARAVICIGPDQRVVYHELVTDISKSPNYQAALASVGFAL